MRLTLRTLLAYLDDTLEPLEIKTIGQKVAESESTQELIARIKQVTRRRRITTPPATGPNAFEPNQVAEYLDNELAPEQVAEVEKICLESDVHLAEIASCHQILTLVLGEPAVVPQTAKERMYGVVRGREAITSRRPSGAGHASAPTSADADADEMFLLGLPFYRRGSWLRWALPLAAVLLFAIVGVALWQTLHSVEQPTTNTYSQAGSSKDTKPVNPPNNATPQANRTNEGKNPSETLPNPATTTPDDKQPKTAKTTGSDSTSRSQDEAKTDASSSKGKLEKSTNEPPKVGRDASPSNDRAEVGQYVLPDFGPKSLLVRRIEKDGWSRLKPNARVYSGDSLMSLPGYASEVRLDCGIHLLLRGHLREFTPMLMVRDESGRERNEAAVMDHLQESTVVLHKPKDTDVDLTLQAGRLYISNHKNDPRGLVVRLRFENKVWDLTLRPEAEFLVDLLRHREQGTSEPQTRLTLFLLKGDAGIALEHDRYPDLSEPGRAQFFWFSVNPDSYARPELSKQQWDSYNRVLFAKSQIPETREAQEMELALKAIRDRMTVEKPPQVALQETLGNNKFAENQLALYCLAALDEVKDLLDVLGKADLPRAPDRDTAVLALRRWLDHGKDQSARLFDPKTKTGLLKSDLGYTTEEAERIVALLRGPREEEIFDPKFYTAMAADLAGDKVAVAELARWWLSRLVLGLFKLDLPNLKSFNAALPRERRTAAKRELDQAIRDGLLPPGEPGKQRGSSGAQKTPKK